MGESIKIQNVESAFASLFPKRDVLRRLKLETEQEHFARLAGLGLEGQEVVFLINKEEISLERSPDNKSIVVLTHSRVNTGGDIPHPSVKIAEFVRASERVEMSNAYGAVVMVDRYLIDEYQFKILNPQKIPSSAKWKWMGSGKHLGISYQTQDPAIIARFRENHYGLAVKGIVGRLWFCASGEYEIEATRENPISRIYRYQTLPIMLTSIHLLEIQTGSSIASIAIK